MDAALTRRSPTHFISLTGGLHFVSIDLRCEGATSRCKGMRVTASSANEGRRFGSLEKSTTKRASHQ
ncbi:hypothetical protein NC653_012929 [Populus alba x Populus x berolinensis]|uniref:Uncharacterized protein n=1 Tax=Populus alba x Populus x berolinensis TaxID=444605 RepID=A0AAD6W1X8_9ROSI|nr:hypothetical protein NC653_012929 [Populus alba x Populus x berolinensis]